MTERRLWSSKVTDQTLLSVKTEKEPLMTVEEILAQARELLQRKGRVSYQALKGSNS